MQLFLEKMYEIFGIKTNVFFGKINNWGTFDSHTFEFLKIWDTNHPEHTDFLNELKKVATNPYVFHNMHDLLDVKKSLI
jgi:hypothetical protein